jgi:proline dehydrogenase
MSPNHNEQQLAAALKHIARNETTPERLQLMRDLGYQTRVYLPYGQEWSLYLCHRLAEYPPNVYQAIIEAVG